MTEYPGKLVPLGIVHTDKHRDQLMRLIEVRWQDGRLALWGRREDTSYPFNQIKKYKGLELLWMAGPERDDYYCDVKARPSVIGKRGYYRHCWEEIHIREEDLKLLCAEIADTGPGTEMVYQPDSIPLMEAVHDLRIVRRTDLRSAIGEMTELMAMGQLPPADSIIDGLATKIDPRWWWVGAIEYPNSSATFNLIVDNEPRLAHATEIRLDRGVWERQRARIAATAQQGSGPFPQWDDPAWDHPVRLLDAIRLWSPVFARRLDQVRWASPDNIRDIARRLETYNHPTRVHARRNRAQGQRDRHLDSGSVSESPGGPRDQAANQDLPEPLLGAWTRLLQEWDHWDDAERLVHAFELAGRVIIEKTRRGQPYILKYAPPPTQGGLSADYKPIGGARHDGLGSYDFDLRNSLIRNPEGNWLAARICGAMDAEAGRRRAARFARREYDAATAAGWAAELEKPFRQRSLFSCFEVAEHLTRKSVAEPDFDKRDRVLLDLDDWIRRGEFDLSGESDAVLRTDERPYFRPFRPADIATILGEMAGLAAHNARCVYLRKSACRRYVEANLELENARRILVLWFPETAPSASRPAAAEKPDSVESERATNALLFDAVTGALRTAGTPGKTVQWQRFCDHVRRECKATAQTRGYGDRSIQRLVKRIEAGRDKPDKCDMS